MTEQKFFAVAQRWARLIISFRKRGTSRFYLGFARLGAVLFLAGVAPWFPSLWQQVVEWLVEIAVVQVEQTLDATAQKPPRLLGWRIGLSAFCLISGLLIIICSLVMFDRANRKVRPGDKNEDAIALKIQSNTTLEGLVSSVAETFGASVKLDEVGPEVRDLVLSSGPISGSSFAAFLDQVSLRTSPPNQVVWEEAGDGFFVARVYD